MDKREIINIINGDIQNIIIPKLVDKGFYIYNKHLNTILNRNYIYSRFKIAFKYNDIVRAYHYNIKDITNISFKVEIRLNDENVKVAIIHAFVEVEKIINCELNKNMITLNVTQELQ